MILLEVYFDKKIYHKCSKMPTGSCKVMGTIFATHRSS